MGCRSSSLVTHPTYSLDFLVVVFTTLFLSVLLVKLVTKKQEEEEDCVWLVFVVVRAPSLWLVVGQGCTLAWLMAKSLIACYLLLEMLLLLQMLLLLAGDVERNPGPVTGEPTCVCLWLHVSSVGIYSTCTCVHNVSLRKL